MRVESILKNYRIDKHKEMEIKLIIGILFLLSFSSFAQRGLLNDPNISTTKIVNEYTTLTSDAATGATIINVTSSSLNANTRFTNTLQPGELVMIIQMQGASVNASIDPGNALLSIPKDSTWGSITSYNNCGYYEFKQVKSIPNGTSIELDCPLENNYTTAGKVQIIRVPRYKTLTINTGGTLTCDAWNGTTGGVVSVEVLGNISINNTGKISASGKGFRGGGVHRVKAPALSPPPYVWAASGYDDNGMQGEGIAGDSIIYTSFGGKYGAGAPANGGGGGSFKSTGGGGGANAGNINLYNPNGTPDISGTNYANAWNIEYAGMSAISSTGGGRGGYGYSANLADPFTYGPNNTQWGTGSGIRTRYGGKGGRPLDYSTGKIFMGGGGGAGQHDDFGNGVKGANGGGIIYLYSFSNVSGNGTIESNGADNTLTTKSDGAGGGGGGGTVIVNSTGTISGISINANGGKGGNQVQDISLGQKKIEGEGPGGGGGGGYIAISNGAITKSAVGGNNGTSDARGVQPFMPNGATKGGGGLPNETINNYTIQTSNVTVCSGNNATLSATLNGTVPSGATVTWYDAATGGNVLGTGNNYTVNNVTNQVIVYVGTCPGTYRTADTIKISSGLPLTLSTNDTSVCSGNGVNLIAGGATTYSWSPSTGLSANNIANPIAFPTNNTTYTVFASDGSGCSALDTVRITVKPKPTINITGTTTICKGDTATLSASGPSTFSWSISGNTNFSFNDSIKVTPTTTTTYTFVGSTNGCFDQKTQVVTVNNLPNINITNSSPQSLCPGDSVQLNASNGVTYSWFPAAGLSQTSGANVYSTPLANTLYTVVGNDGNCSNTDTISVFIKQVTGVTFNPSAPSICPGQSTTITASGNSNYSWFSPTGIPLGNNTSITVSPATDSTYFLVFQSNGCTLADTIRVSVGNSINVMATSSADSICLGDNVTLTAQNGSSHVWNNDPSLTNINGTTVSASPTTTTTYTVTGGSGLCSDTGIVTVVVISNNVNITTAQTLICRNSSAVLNASGAGNFSWSTGETGNSIIVSPASLTTYTVIGADASGLCPSVGTITIDVDTIKIQISGNNQVCEGETTTLTASNGINYTWSNGSGSNNISPIITSDTTYTLFGTNTNGCLDTVSYLVTASAKPIVTINGNDSICAGTSTTLTANGANSYSWQSSSGFSGNNTENVSPTNSASYIVYGETNGCINSDTINITVLSTPNITGPTSIQQCIGASDNIQVNGSPNYTWSPLTGLTVVNDSNVIASPVSSTIYTVTGGINTCTDTLFINIDVDSSPVNLSLTATNDSICSNESSTLTVTGALTYSWSPATGLNNTTSDVVLANPSSSTSYTVIGTNTYCKDTSYFTLHVLTTPVISVNPTSISICEGKSSNLTASGNATNYSWLPASTLNTNTGTNVIANPTSTTNYTIVGYNSICADSAFASVNVSPAISVSTNITDTTLCNGMSVAINASGSINYSWIPVNGLNSSTSANVIANPTSTINYTVIGYNAACSDSAVINVVVLPDLNLSVTAGNTTICTGDNTVLSATSLGSSYSWFPNVNLSNTNTSTVTASPLGSQVYSVFTTDGQCFDTASIYIEVLAGINVSINASPGSVCEGENSTLSATGAVNYVWTNGGETSTDITVTPSSTTVYTVVGLNGTCTDSAFYSLTVNPKPDVVAIKDQSIAIGSSADIQVSGASTYVWSPAENLSCSNCANPTASPKVTTTYSVIATDANGCTNTASVTITVDENYAIFVPTAFSPNNDGENDVLYVRGRGISEMKIVIFNGWGEKVFESDSETKGWDGTRNGKALNSGVFVYQLSGKYFNGSEFSQKGDVTLMK